VLRKTVIALALIGALAVPASASADTVASGSLSLKPAGGFKAQLSHNGTRMKPKSFAISGGDLDPTTGAGSLKLRGKLTFKRGGDKAVFKGLRAKLGAGGKLTGQLKGRKTTIAKLAGGSVQRSGFSAAISGITAKFTGSAAGRINKALHLGSLHAGKLGTATVAEKPAAVAIEAKDKATFTASDEAAMQFLMHGVMASAIPPAEQNGPLPTSFLLPIAGGTAAPDLTDGQTQLAGGIRQEGNGNTVDLINFLLQWDQGFLRADSPQLGSNGIAFLDKSTATISSDPQARTITFEDVTLRFNDASANITNLMFGTTFKANDPLGTISATLTAR
jgi:hypothetical protein